MNGNLQIKEQMDKLMFHSSKTQSSGISLKRGAVPYSQVSYHRYYRPSPLHPLKMTFCFLLFPFIPLAVVSLCVQQPPLDDRRTDRDSVFSPVCGATL